MSSLSLLPPMQHPISGSLIHHVDQHCRASVVGGAPVSAATTVRSRLSVSSRPYFLSPESGHSLSTPTPRGPSVAVALWVPPWDKPPSLLTRALDRDDSSVVSPRVSTESRFGPALCGGCKPGGDVIESRFFAERPCHRKSHRVCDHGEDVIGCDNELTCAVWVQSQSTCRLSAYDQLVC